MEGLVDKPEENYKSCYLSDPQNGHITCSRYRVWEDEPQLLAKFKKIQTDGEPHDTRICERLSTWILAEEEGGR